MKLKYFDAVVFDPPRAGAEFQSKELARSAVKKIVAVSCNPLTLARDLAILVEGGYGITRVTPIDQFQISGPKPAHGNAVAGGGLAISTGAWSVGLGFDYLYASSGNTSEEGTITLLGRI